MLDPFTPTSALSRDTLAQVAGAMPTPSGVRTKPAWAPSAFGSGQADPGRDRWYDEPTGPSSLLPPARGSGRDVGGAASPPTTPGRTPAPAPSASGSNDLQAAAQQIEAETGIPAAVLLAIPVNESGNKWGPGSTPYGIKAGGGYSGQTTGSVPTWEVYNGQHVNINDNFRTYNTPVEAMRDFVNFLRGNSRYASALKGFQQTGDPAVLLRGLNRAGYATDPIWSEKILNIMHRQSGGSSVIAPSISGGETARSSQSSGSVLAPTQQAASTSQRTPLPAPTQPQVAKAKHHFTYVDDGQEVLKIIREDGGQEFHVLGKQSPHPNGTVTDPGNLPIGGPLPPDVTAAMPQWEQQMYAAPEGSQGTGEGVGRGQDEADPGAGDVYNVPGGGYQVPTGADVINAERAAPPPPSPVSDVPPALTPQRVLGGYQKVGAQPPEWVAGWIPPPTPESVRASAPKSPPPLAPDVEPSAVADPSGGITNIVQAAQPETSAVSEIGKYTTGTSEATPLDVAGGVLGSFQREVFGAVPATPSTPVEEWRPKPSAVADAAGGITNVVGQPEEFSLDPRVAIPRAIEREKEAPVQAMAAEFALDPVNAIGGVLGGLVAGSRAASWAHRAHEATFARTPEGIGKVVPGLTRLMEADEYDAIMALHGYPLPPKPPGAPTGEFREIPPTETISPQHRAMAGGPTAAGALPPRPGLVPSGARRATEAEGPAALPSGGAAPAGRLSVTEVPPPRQIPRIVVPDLDSIHLEAAKDPVARVVRAVASRLPKPATRGIELTPSVAAAHPEGARMVESDINAAARLRVGKPAPGEQVQALYPGGAIQRFVDQRLRTPFTDRLASLETQDTYIHLRDLAIHNALGFSTLDESAQGYRMARQLTGAIGKAQAWAEEAAAPIFKNYGIHAGEEARSFEAFMRAYEYVQRTNTTDVLDATGTLLKGGRPVPLPSGPAVGASQRKSIELLNTVLDDAEAKFGSRSTRPIPPANLGPGLQLPATPTSVRARFFAAHQALSETMVPYLREMEAEGMIHAGGVNEMLAKHPVYTHIQTIGEHFQGWAKGDILPRSLPTSPIIGREIGSERLSDVSLDGLFARNTAVIQAIERQKIANALEDWRKMDPQGFGQMMRPLSHMEMENYHRGHLVIAPGTQLIPRLDNGRMQLYEVPDILGDALMGLNKEQVGMVEKGVGRLTRSFTGLVTAYSPGFIVNNYLRHELAAHHNLQLISGVDWSRLKVLGVPTVLMPTENRLLLENMLSSFWDSITSGEKGQNLVSILQKQRMPTLEERATMAAANPRRQMRQLSSEIYMRGYAHSSDAARTRSFESYLPKDETPIQKLGRAAVNAGQPWKLIRAGAEVTEMSTRVNVFKAALAAGKTPEEAAYLGRTVTIDYAKGGSVVKALNMWLPFVNSRVQAIGRPLEAFDKNPAKFAVQQAFSTVLPWATTYALNRMPQWSDMYDRISRWEKQNYFIIPVGTYTLPSGQQNMLRINIRKDEGSMLVTNLMEYMADQMFHTSYAGKPLSPEQRDERNPFQMWLQELRMTVPIPENPNEAKEGWGGLLWSAAMDFPLASIMHQQETGTDNFGQPVVPPEQQSLPPEFQYGQAYHPSSALLAEQLGSLSQGKWQPSPAGTSWLFQTIPLGQIVEGMGDSLVDKFGVLPTGAPSQKPGAPTPKSWDQLAALQKQKAAEDTRPWWAKLFSGVVRSSGGAQSFTAKLQEAPPEVRVPLQQSQQAASDYSEWRMSTYYPERRAIMENADKTGQQKRDQLSQLAQRRQQAYDDAYAKYPQAVKDWKQRKALIEKIPGVPVSVANVESAADLDPQFSSQIPQAAAQYTQIQQAFAGQLPAQEIQKRQAQVIQNYAGAWGVDPAVARDAIKAQLNQLQMPVAGVPNAAVDQWVNRYLVPENEIDFRELDASGRPTGSDDPILLRRSQSREIERISAETGLPQNIVRERVNLRLSSPEEQTPEALSLNRAQDLVSRVHDPSQFPAFIDPITHKPLARADGSPSGPDDWQHWGQQIGAAESQKATSRAVLPESVRHLVAAQAEGKRVQLVNGLFKDPHAYLDYLRWYGYGKNLTDKEWGDYLNGAQARYKDVKAADIAEATRRDMAIALAKTTPTVRNKMLTNEQWNALPEAERNQRIQLGAAARRYAKQAVPKWQDALMVDEVTPGKDASAAMGALISDQSP